MQTIADAMLPGTDTTSKKPQVGGFVLRGESGRYRGRRRERVKISTQLIKHLLNKAVLL